MVGSMKMKRLTCLFALVIAANGDVLKTGGDELKVFDPEKDLLSLHYDHAPDRDDGHSTAADRTLLESLYGAHWLPAHVVAVSGAYGLNKQSFNPKSDAVMDATWNDRGGWIAADRDRAAAVATLLKRWVVTLETGGDVYVKEGGQSDITAELVKLIREQHPDIDSQKRIHVVQHSDWNENHTTPNALAYTQENTNYIRIPDANRYLNRPEGDATFGKVAAQHPLFGKFWSAAFAYYPPEQRLDFSDTGELMHILGLGELGIDDFRSRFLDEHREKIPNAPSKTAD